MTPPTAALLSVLLALAAAPAAAHDHADHASGHAAHDDDHAHEQGEDGDAHADHVAEAHGLRALHAWTRATDADETLVFVDLENRSDAPLTLTGGGSPVAAAGALAGFALKDGAPTLAPIAALPLDPGGKIALAPFGLALRLTGLTRQLAQGDRFEAFIDTDRGPLTMVVEVEGADARSHSHAGHSHD